jgi:hypothetical protein
LLGFRAGQKHQEQQAEPVNKVEDISLMLRAIDQVREERQTAEQCRAENDAGQNFADNFRLPQLNEQIPEQVGKSNQEKKNEQNGCQRGIRHCSGEMLIAQSGLLAATSSNARFAYCASDFRQERRFSA